MTFEQPPRPRWGLRIALAAGCALVLALGVVTVSWAFSECGSGTSRVGNECVGVTFGDEVFSPELEPIEKLIQQENEDIEDDELVATVGVLMPMTAEADDSLSIKQIRHYLEGAYLAQRNANDEGRDVKIRLALANEGRYEHASSAVTDQLVDMAEAQNLQAVVGLGLSSPATVDGAEKLAAADVPMVGYLSADRFNSLASEGKPAINGLTRVTPSLQQELGTIADHLEEVLKNQSTRAVLVYDMNENDLYTADLKKNFQAEFRDELARTGNASGPYTGGEDAFGNSTTFGYIANQLCGADGAPAADVVLYAGRSNLLPKFVAKVRGRDCASQPLTIITGSESTDLRLPDDPKNTPVSVVYASVSDPVALRAPGNPLQTGFAEFEDEVNSLPKPDRLRDQPDHDANPHVSNWSVMGHDTTITAILAIKRSAADVREVPTGQGVTDALNTFHGRGRVIGVSGSIELVPGVGDRTNMNLPILSRSPGEAPTKILVSGSDPDQD